MFLLLGAFLGFAVTLLSLFRHDILDFSAMPC